MSGDERPSGMDPRGTIGHQRFNTQEEHGKQNEAKGHIVVDGKNNTVVEIVICHALCSTSIEVFFVPSSTGIDRYCRIALLSQISNFHGSWHTHFSLGGRTGLVE